MTKSDFYKAMALNLAKNLSREVSPILNVLLTKNDTTDGESEVPVLVNGKMQVLAELKATESYTDIIIDEVEQPWRRGVAQVEPVNFNTTCGTVLVDGDDVIWGTVEKRKVTLLTMVSKLQIWSGSIMVLEVIFIERLHILITLTLSHLLMRLRLIVH